MVHGASEPDAAEAEIAHRFTLLDFAEFSFCFFSVPPLLFDH